MERYLNHRQSASEKCNLLVVSAIACNSIETSELRPEDSGSMPTDPAKLGTFAERIAWLVDRSGLPQNHFAECINVSEGMLSQWVNDKLKGGVARRSNLISIARLFRADVGRMIAFLEKGGDPPMLQPVSANGASHPDFRPMFKGSESAGRIPAGTLPIINQVPAGKGTFTNQDYPPNWSHDTVDAGPWASPGSQAFFVHGDSMEPTFIAGDLVVGDPARAITSGCYAIVQFGPERDDENRIRRVIQTESGTMLVPSNEAFESEVVPPEHIRMMLRIVEFRRKLPWKEHG